MLYKKWFENVSSPLLQTIQDKIDNQSSEEIEERKRKQLSLYLNYCNTKVLVKTFFVTGRAIFTVPSYIHLLRS